MSQGDSEKIKEIAIRLHRSIVDEHNRLSKRPVTTTPWIMPLSLDELDKLATFVIDNLRGI